MIGWVVRGDGRHGHDGRKKKEETTCKTVRDHKGGTSTVEVLPSYYVVQYYRTVQYSTVRRKEFSLLQVSIPTQD